MRIRSNNFIMLDITLVKKMGLNQAIIFSKILAWQQHNEQQGLNYRDGKTWVYNTIESWVENIEILKRTTLVKNILQLTKDGWIISTSQYNKYKYDRTLWYTINLEKLAAELPHLVVTESRKNPLSNSDNSLLSNSDNSLLSNSDKGLLSNSDTTIPIYKQLNNSLDNPVENKIPSPDGDSPPSKKPPVKKTTRKKKIKTWDDNDPLKGVFKNIVSLKEGEMDFDTPSYTKWILALSESLSLSIPILEAETFRWAEFHDNRIDNRRVKSVKASLRTWMNITAAKQEKQEFKPKPKAATQGGTILNLEEMNYDECDDNQPW